MNDWEFDLVFGLSKEAHDKLGSCAWGPFTLATAVGWREFIGKAETVSYTWMGIDNVQTTNNLRASDNFDSKWL